MGKRQQSGWSHTEVDRVAEDGPHPYGPNIWKPTKIDLQGEQKFKMVILSLWWAPLICYLLFKSNISIHTKACFPYQNLPSTHLNNEKQVHQACLRHKAIVIVVFYGNKQSIHHTENPRKHRILSSFIQNQIQLPVFFITFLNITSGSVPSWHLNYNLPLWQCPNH